MHQNLLTGSFPSFQFSRKFGYLNLASNFLNGNVPNISSSVIYDFRFNFFDNCDELCCLTNAACTDNQCAAFNEMQFGSFPNGIKESVWTEMVGVSVMGVPKRIIQIETYFDSVPYLLSSFACPNISNGSLALCNSSREIFSAQNYTTENAIVLNTNESYVHSQIQTTSQQFIYSIQGNPCTTSVKVYFDEYMCALFNPFPFQILVTPSTGDPDLNVTYGNRVYLERRIGRDEVLLCPPLHDTIVHISVAAYNSFSSYTISVTEYPMAIAPLLDYFQSHPDLVEIGDGRDEIFYVNTPWQYQFLVVSLNLSCSFHVQSKGNSLLTLALDGYNYSVTEFPYSGRSYLDVSLCPSDSNSNVTFFVNTSGQIEIFATSSNLTEIVSLHSLSFLDCVDILSSQIYFKTDPSVLCNVSNIWTTTSSSPLNPPQSFLFMSTVPFDRIQWNLPHHPDGDSRVLYTYLLLDDGYEGTAEEVMNQFNFTFGPGLVDQYGHRLVGNGTIHPVPKMKLTCDPAVMTILVDSQKDVIDHLVRLNFSQISDAYNTFLISDSIRANLTWIACSQQIEYMNRSNLVNGTELCGDWECTNLTLTTYHVDKDQIDRGYCDLSATMVTDANADSIWYKECKESVYSVTSGKRGRPCIQDSDCLYPWTKAPNMTYVFLNSPCTFDPVNNNEPPPCNTILGICADTHDEAEDLFWWCFVQKMSLDVQLTLSLQGIDGCNATELKSSFVTDDCVSVSGTGMEALVYRNRYHYISPDVTASLNDVGGEDDTTTYHCECYQAVGKEYDLCLDRLCNKPPQCEFSSYDAVPVSLITPSENSLKSDVCSYSLEPEPGDNVSCLEEYRCNWNPSVSVKMTNDTSICGVGYFCGVYFDTQDIFFFEMVNMSANECTQNEGKVCVSPSGSLLYGELTDQECESVGYCTVDCPNLANHSQCLPINRRNASLCYNDSTSLDPSSCAQQSGRWIGKIDGWERSACVFSLQNNRRECERNGNTFITCNDFSRSECGSNLYLSCYVSESTASCDTKDDCLSDGIGYCSDSDYFVNYLTTPPINGACVIPFLTEVESTGIRRYCYRNTIPMSLGFADFHQNLCVIF